ncbi:SDR family oxidoreductase [Curvivirga aplysinae]|uniref:SDR family oxidoreductase n=1 Tax=Curvivirga aplysinae TaxID=2529852 RepID=UPI0012BC2778|nr:SDR family oxidoreductase [Curvivirga aplysinae]MTI08416.1 SDR family oxidoreductase [Curvivirga aplysinae]
MKKIAITGVSRGLGYALLHECASRDVRVFGTCRSEKQLQKLQDEFGAQHEFYLLDTTNVDQMNEFATNVYEDGQLDAFIANAGIINDRLPAWEVPVQVWKTNIDVNLMGMVHSINAFIPKMINAEHGCFIGMSSGWGREASDGLAPYCASKFAVEGLIGSLVLDLAQAYSSVQAIALDPGGGINTDMLAACLPDSHTDYKTPEIWAKVAVDYIINDLLRNNRSGSFTIPD